MKNQDEWCDRKNKATEGQRPVGEKTAWPKIKGIHPGAVVRLHDLKSVPQLNGRKGRLTTFDEETGRWKVDLGDEYKNIKVDNLTPAPGEKPPSKATAEADKKEAAAIAEKRAAMSAREVYAQDYGWDG